MIYLALFVSLVAGVALSKGISYFIDKNNNSGFMFMILFMVNLINALFLVI